ncbi:MAG: cytochrome c [Gemmatimonadota bacterium]
MRWIALPLVFVLGFAGCGPSAEETAAAAAAAAAAAEDSLLAASVAAFDASVFDTLTWESEAAALARGAQVYTFSCARCHGPQGLGDSGFVRGGDTLRPPSFREPTWRLADDKEGIRGAIFIGTGESMPHWGLEGLKAESIDAVTLYILKGLGGS